MFVRLIFGGVVGGGLTYYCFHKDRLLTDGLCAASSAIGCPAQAQRVDVHLLDRRLVVDQLLVHNPNSRKDWQSNHFIQVKQAHSNLSFMQKEGIVVAEELVLQDVEINLERSMLGKDTNYALLLKQMDQALGTDTTTGEGDQSAVLFIKKTKLKNVKVRFGLAPELNPLKNLFVTVLIPELEVVEDSASAYDLRRPGKMLLDVLKTVVLSCLYTAKDVSGAEDLLRLGIDGLRGVHGISHVAVSSTIRAASDAVSTVGELDRGAVVVALLAVLVTILAVRKSE
jgi:hypothetical protein